MVSLRLHQNVQLAATNDNPAGIVGHKKKIDARLFRRRQLLCRYRLAGSSPRAAGSTRFRLSFESRSTSLL
jgi:hypothetical protein